MVNHAVSHFNVSRYYLVEANAFKHEKGIPSKPNHDKNVLDKNIAFYEDGAGVVNFYKNGEYSRW